MEFLLESTNWVLISFLIFAIIFMRVGKGALLNKLDSRIEDIKKEIDTAESLRVEAQELLAQYQRKQRDAAKEADAIIANAKDHAEKIRAEAEAEMEASLKRREEQMQDRLRRMEEKAAANIRAYAAELAVRATKEIIVSEMNEANNNKLIDSTIKNVGAKLTG